MKKILFVCTGNTFRSPSAEYLFDLYVKEHGGSYVVSSAGTKGWPPGPFQKTIEEVGMFGADMSKHQYRVLTQEIADGADIIICMAEHHRKTLKQTFGKESYLFNELALGESTDLKDDDEAVGEYGDLNEFIEYTITLIHERIPALYKRLQSMNL